NRPKRSRSNGARLRRRALSVGGPRLERCPELVAGVDVQLPIDVAEVVLDRLGAEEERGCRLARRPAGRAGEGGLELLRRPLGGTAGIAAPRRLARRREFRAGELRPRRRPEQVERVERRAELLACARAVTRAPQP